jgi:hypothetical protein
LPQQRTKNVTLTFISASVLWAAELATPVVLPLERRVASALVFTAQLAEAVHGALQPKVFDHPLGWSFFVCFEKVVVFAALLHIKVHENLMKISICAIDN